MSKYYFKYVIVGNASVGKSCLLVRFTDDKFDIDYKTTIGVDFKFKNVQIEDSNIKLQIWDTAGQEKYQSITKSFYKGADGVIIVFDLTSEESFLNVQTSWLEEVQKHCTTDIELMLIGNKSDLTSQIEVQRQKAQEFAQQNNMLYYEASAMEGTNVFEAFNQFTKNVFEKN